MVGQRRDRQQAKLRRMAAEIWRKYESPLRRLKDVELAAEEKKLRERAAEAPLLDVLLPEAYALVRETARRTLSMRPTDNQIEGAIALHKGMIIEMANGDGKTLTATLPAYLNSLGGQKIHIATYNEYLASRDARWMGPLYMALGMSVSVILPDLDALKLERQETTYELVACSRKEAYDCDIIYGTYKDFVFDYLRDNIVSNASDIVQNRLDFIILDEVDSVLIDLARTPIIISTQKARQPHFYYLLWSLACALHQDEHYSLRSMQLTQQGIQLIEQSLRSYGLITSGKLYSVENAGIAQQIVQSLHARHSYVRDRHYIIKDNHLEIIDEYTGRPYEGRYSDGLQQAIEVKENLPITAETDRLAEISYQHFFKLYNKMAGMTATASERKNEFRSVYNMPVVVILPAKPSQRIDLPDSVYKSGQARMHQIVEDVRYIHSTGRPILIDTQTIEKAEEIGQMLKEVGIEGQILHAKYYEEEARIIAAAGQKGVVTIAAKMAGRGTDIVINDDVLAYKSWHNIKGKDVEIAGLHVIGIERNGARHIDRQLIGRAGRQGKPGSSQFFLALDDDLLRPYITDLLARMMQEDMALDSGIMTGLIARAQERDEQYSLAARQRSYEFDGVLDKQRQRIYAIRRKAISHKDLTEDINIMMENIVLRSMKKYLPEKQAKRSWDIAGMSTFFLGLSLAFDADTFNEFGQKKRQDIKERLLSDLHAIYNARVKEINETGITQQDQKGITNTMQEYFLVPHLDKGWREHLGRLADLQQEMHLRTSIEKDYLNWYMMRSNELFWEMIERIEVGFLRAFFSNWAFQMTPSPASQQSSSSASSSPTG